MELEIMTNNKSGEKQQKVKRVTLEIAETEAQKDLKSMFKSHIFKVSLILNAVFVVILVIVFLKQNKQLDNNTMHKVRSLVVTEEVHSSESTNQFRIIPSLQFVEPYPGDKIPDTTTTDVPKIFQIFLNSFSDIDEKVSDKYPAKDAVAKLEAEVGWNPEKSDFLHPNKISYLWEKSVSSSSPGECKTDPESFLKMLLNGKELHSVMDIVVPSIRNLDFLELWKVFIEKFHIIIIQDGDPNVVLKIPDWVDYELYNRIDIENVFGQDAWIISQKDASIRNFGFLVSQKQFIWSLDDDCYPAKDNNGNMVNALIFHAINLLTPSTPYFFNTVYDPYKNCVDFVRGYPYSLRRGVKTAVSHGLWLNMYDYDAPTQLLKVHERNNNYAEITITIPFKILYPLCSMNVAFNKELIGPALMQGLMGAGQPWGRYDDMFSGWASKVVADHLRLGTKSGSPYIHHNKASNPFTNLAKEYMGLQWQEEVIRFFDQLVLSPQANTASLAYLELANCIERDLIHLSPYFEKLANAMRIWTSYWTRRQSGLLTISPSRSSHGSPVSNVPAVQLPRTDKRVEDKDAMNNLFTLENIHPHPLWNQIYPVFPVPTKISGLPQCASKMKVFIYNLPNQYHIDVLTWVNQQHRNSGPKDCGVATSPTPCAESHTEAMSGIASHSAEMFLMSKFLLLPQTAIPSEATLFIVPFFMSSFFYQHGCPIEVRQPPSKDCNMSLFIAQYLPHYKNNERKHVFFATRDRWQLVNRDIKDSILFHSGPKAFNVRHEIVVPSSMAMFGHPLTPLVMTKYFLFFMASLINDNRRHWWKVLQSIHGTHPHLNLMLVEMKGRNFELTGTETVKLMKESLLCVTPVGDLPWQHRFYDVIAAGCVPITTVFNQNVNHHPCPSYWGHGGGYNLESCVNLTYPYPSKINWRSIVMEVPEDIFNNHLDTYLINLYHNRDDILQKRKKIDSIRYLLQYEWNGNIDAFSLALEEVCGVVEN